MNSNNNNSDISDISYSSFTSPISPTPPLPPISLSLHNGSNDRSSISRPRSSKSSPMRSSSPPMSSPTRSSPPKSSKSSPKSPKSSPSASPEPLESQTAAADDIIENPLNSLKSSSNFNDFDDVMENMRIYVIIAQSILNRRKMKDEDADLNKFNKLNSIMNLVEEIQQPE
ncbi:11336_t:CDS:2 [Diversispora eburnea]|uniref:11336_t:CDS:1 n=1 Tax=Diversispora eburnea TaxID=1213867 RepID=A0A9N9FSL3_9GLOM|nr:11336_t:CDS:2 [Diversispora eburnea]